jgi:hypothetical protein
MTALAQLLLVLTSLAPIGLVYAGVLADSGLWVPAAILTVVALSLALICPQVMRGAQRVLASGPRAVVDVAGKEGESLSFLVAYALPILAVDKPTEPVFWGLIVFGVIVGVTMWQQQVFHVNPLLALMGYHFYSARNDAGGQVLILTKSKVLPAGDLQITLLSSYLWLEHSEPETEGTAVDGGVIAGDRIRQDD